MTIVRFVVVCFLVRTVNLWLEIVHDFWRRWLWCVFVGRVYTDNVIYIINIFTNGIDNDIFNI